ncbi:hypothetical protein BDV10DRAFT_69548 [Aspergillus recurvatus]
MHNPTLVFSFSLFFFFYFISDAIERLSASFLTSCPVDTPSCIVCFSLPIIPERATAAPVCHFSISLSSLFISIAQRHTLSLFAFHSYIA